MADFYKSNRSLKTVDLMLLVASVGVVFTVFGATLAHSLRDNKPARAQSMAANLAHQIRSNQYDPHLSGGAGRSPASVQNATEIQLFTSGSLGRDPWGRAFHYFVRRKEGSEGVRPLIRIYVWSGGPDGISNTDMAAAETDASQAAKFQGDDTGFVEEFPLDL